MSKPKKKIEGFLPGLGEEALPFIPTKKHEEDKSRVGKFKRSGHLTDQILKYNYPKDNSKQTSIFDSLMESTKKEIKNYPVKITEIAEGIKLAYVNYYIIKAKLQSLLKIIITQVTKDLSW